MDGPSVSRSFLKDLKLMDPRLGLKFNGNHFVVTYRRPIGDDVNIHRIKAEDGGFKYPDRRDLEFIKGGDLANTDMKTRLLKLSAYSENIRAKARKDAHDNIRHMTLDGKNQLAKAAVQLTNMGKGNATFRRIEQNRTGGRTWEEIKAGG